MRIVRDLGILALALGVTVVVLSPARRAFVARLRRVVSRRFVDAEARASCVALDTWNDDGGAMPESMDRR